VKNTFRTLGIIAIIAVMAFSMASCAFMAEAMQYAVTETYKETGAPLIGTWIRDSDQTWTFNSDGSVRITGQGAIPNSKWTVNENRLSLSQDAGEFMSGTYSIDGNTLTYNVEQLGGITLTLTRQ
jgi:hypothetical protein